MLSIAVLGFLLFSWRVDPGVVAPRNVERLLATGGDPAMSEMGWEYFRQEPWSWPPGRCRNYGAPFGSSIALVDGIPLLGLAGKLFVGRDVGPWQYFGLWLLSTYILQALAAWLATGLVLDRPLPRFLAAALLLLMPTFLQRTGHMALSAHWLVLFGVVLYGRRSGWPPWVGLAAVASLIHPYLTAMVCALAAASLLKSWRVDGTVGFRPMVAIMVAVLVVVGAGWWTGGMFVYGLDISGGDLGYGAFSANLNALVNPLGTSRFLPALPLADSRQYEGFNYLGLGLLALWVLACVGLITDRSRVVSLRDHWPLVLVLVCLSIFAVSLRVTFCEWQLMRTDAPRILAAPINAFRASGRFLWPLTYAGTLYGFSYLRARAGTRWQVALLAVMLAVQLIDLGPILQRRSSFASEQIVSRLENPAWSLVMARTDRLLTVPPLEAGTQLPYDFLDLNLPLVSRGVPTSAAYVTRVNTAAIDRWTTAFKAELESGRRLEPGTTLVVRASEMPAFLAVLAPDRVAHNLDGFVVFVDESLRLPGVLTYTGAQPTDLPAFLDAHRRETLVLAACDDATNGLSEEARFALGARGVEVGRLEFRCSFGAVLAPDHVVWQDISPEHAVTRSVSAPRALSVTSAGLNHGNRASIRLDDIEYAMCQRGLNILLLDEDWRPVALGFFDTFVGDAGWSLDCAVSSP